MQENQEKRQGLLATPRRKVLAAMMAVFAAGGIYGAQAFADSRTFGHLKVAAMDGGWRHGHGHWGGKRFSQMSEEEVRSKITRMVRHAAIEVDATDEQEQKIIALLSDAAGEILPLRSDMENTRKELHDLLLADRIDREALERLRAARLAEFDRISEKLVGTIADVAEILTPEQRALAEERMKAFCKMRHGRDRG